MHAIDTYTASSMGAYSLTENYLYTVEAFKDFHAKLSDDGVMAIRRWLFYPPRENLRLFWEASGRPLDDADFETALQIAGLGASIDRGQVTCR